VRLVELAGPALPGEARNAGLRVTRGRYISFPGSHVELPRGSLAARLRAHDLGYTMVTGAVINGASTRAGWASYFLDQFLSLPGQPSHPMTRPPSHCSYAHDALLEVGGFPEDLRTGEDTAVNTRLYRLGHRAYRSSEVQLIHTSPCTTTGELVRHHFKRGGGYTRLLLESVRRGEQRVDRALVRRLVVGYLPTRLRAIERNVRTYGGDLRRAYRWARPLVVLGAVGAWAGIWYRLLVDAAGYLAHGRRSRLVGRIRRWRRSLREPLPVLGILLHRRVEPTQRRLEAAVAAAWFGQPARRLRLVGITGTNGKTTTCHLLASILRADGRPVGMHSTLEGHAHGILTTPNPWALHRYLRRLVHEGCQWGVLEVSSHALTLNRVSGIRFEAVAVTNVTRDHLDFHGTIEEYAHAKGLLFRSHPPVGVVNADDPWSAVLKDRPVGRLITFGIDHPADVTVRDVDVSGRSPAFTLVTPAGSAPVRLQQRGAFNVANALTAAAVATGLSVPIDAIVAGLQSTIAVPGRAEWVDAGQGFGVVVDYAHSADSMAQLYDYLRPFTPGRLIAVFGADADRDRGKRPQLGAVVAERCEVVVLTTGDRSPREHPARIAEEVLDGVRGLISVVVELDRPRAIGLALAEAHDGDTVAITGCGPEPYETFDGVVTDDRSVVRDLLAAQASP
jgi:UDP-N-acetylmuramoyl-L-alanyl-D-glutamate--2,6-diaminopimelate ligase